jgi:predicted RNA-binding protein YlxR (DUF448 family)
MTTTGSVAMRTCLGCRRRRPKVEMVRLVRRTDGRVGPDRTGPGRGAYVCREPACVERALKPGRLAHAFRRPSEAETTSIETVVSGR